MSDIDHALSSSWSGYNVRAIFKKRTYNLYLDSPYGVKHLELMAIVCPSIKGMMSVAERMTLYGTASYQLGLMTGWKDFDIYPKIEVN